MSRLEPAGGLPTLAVDLGGTRLRGALVTPDGEIVRQAVEPTPHGTRGPEVISEIAAAVRAGEPVERAVVGVTGRSNYAAGALEHAPNLPAGWLPAINEKGLSGSMGLPVSLANDADLAALGEARFGAGRGYADVAYVTFSTGIGAGVLLGGHLIHGQHSLTEIGHTVIDREALARGEPAILEDLASGTALRRLAEAAGIDGGGAEVVERVRRGDPHAEHVWQRVVEAGGIGLANLAQLYCPQVIVVGGGLGLVGELFLQPLRDAVARLGPPYLPEPIAVVVAELGDDAGLRGAAAWATAF